MRKTIFILSLCVACFNAMSQTFEAKDFTDVLSPQTYVDLPFAEADLADYKESGACGIAGDFNNDGVDDFILTGGSDKNGPAYMFLYLGQKNATPLKIDLGALFDGGLQIGGNGAIDSYKLEDGTWVFALQGGHQDVWTNPFTTILFSLTFDDATPSVTVLSDDITFGDGAGGGSILLLDVNEDGYPDIFQTGWANKDDMWSNPALPITRIYVNDGEYNFEESTMHDIPAVFSSRAYKADFNGDGKLDILFGNTKAYKYENDAPVNRLPYLYVFLNKGDETFEEIQVLDYSDLAYDDHCVVSAGVLDFNNDGYWDIVASASDIPTNTTKLRLFENDGTGYFTEIEQETTGGASTFFIGGQRGLVSCADFNQDGNTDIIITCESNEYGTWSLKSYLLIGNGKGQFDQFEITENFPPVCGWITHGGASLVGDFNGDKTPDLMLFGRMFNGNYHDGDGSYKGDIYFNQSEPFGTGITFVSVDDLNINIKIEHGVLSVSGIQDGKMSIYSLAGSTLIEKKPFKENEELRLDLEKGVYVVSLSIGDKVYSRKIIL